jgi:glycosyltransferase involved in cell wall biosynthesis
VSGVHSDIKVKIHVITYRRSVLLKRALYSLIAQTHKNWVAEVINDDPDDNSVAGLIDLISDPRIYLSTPMVKRGGSGNFNQAFLNSTQSFAGLLEDDNWYEPDFLEIMLQALIESPQAKIAVANEKIWLEKADGSWVNTNKTIWPEKPVYELYYYQLKDKCGSAKICNSSMLWRTGEAKNWLTPEDLPIDVTEHFRERVLPHPILLVHTPLVNYAQTIYSNRSNAMVWSSYQILLISSALTRLNHSDREKLAEILWAEARFNRPLFKTTLLHTAFSHQCALVLLKKAKITDIFKYVLSWLRKPATCYKIICAHRRYPSHWHFLLQFLPEQADALGNTLNPSEHRPFE